MQNLQQKPSKEQQLENKRQGLLSIFLGQAEFSKKMAIFDTIYYIIFVVASIILACVWPPFAGICPDLVTIFTTGLVTLRLGYTAKASLENWNKIKSKFRKSSHEEEYEENEEVG